MGWPGSDQRLHQASAHGFVDFFVGWVTVGIAATSRSGSVTDGFMQIHLGCRDDL